MTSPTASLDERARRLLRLLRDARRKEAVLIAVRPFGVASTADWGQLESLLPQRVMEGRLALSVLADLLALAEENGRKHVFLFNVESQPVLERLGDAERIRAAVAAAGHASAWESDEVFEQPSVPVLARVSYTGRYLRVKWVGSHVAWERADEEDRLDDADDDVVYRAYRRHRTRTVDHFRLDRLTGQAELAIHATGDASYPDVRDSRLDELRAFFPVDALLPVELDALVRWALDPEISEVRQRKGHRTTLAGSSVVMGSPDSRTGFAADPTLVRVHRDVQDRSVARIANIYWRASDGLLSRDVHTILYGREEGSRIAFPAALQEEEVRYVLSRVRALSGS